MKEKTEEPKKIGRPGNTGKQRTRKQMRELWDKIVRLRKLGYGAGEIPAMVGIPKPTYFFYIKKFDRDWKLRQTDIKLKTKPLNVIETNLNPIQFCEQYLAVKPKPMQTLILKVFYNLPLDDIEKMTLQKLKNEGKTTWEEGGVYNELVLMIGMKGGKTVLASIIAQIEEYRLFQKVNPSEYYGLVPGDAIYIKNVASSAPQAEKTIFAKIKASVERSPYFKTRDPRLTGTTYHFHDTNVYIESGHSNSSSLVGDACILVLLDELDRFVNSKSGKYSAEEVYSALDKSTDPFNRGKFRDGKKVSISSLINRRGFFMSLYQKCGKIPSMLGFWMAEWEMQSDLYSGKKFYHHKLGIPFELRDSYNKDPEKFLRDKACIIGYTEGAYYREANKIKEIFEISQNEGYKDPLDSLGRFAEWFKAKEGMKYYMHHDPSLNHDAYGIAIGHKEGEKVIIDFAYRIVPEGGLEIDSEKVVAFCQDIFKKFPSFELISYDTWSAASIMQLFKKEGHKVDNFFVKKTHHDILKELIYTKKIRMYKYEKLYDELSELQLEGEKVDHPKSGSKDVADAVAAVASKCAEEVQAESVAITSGGSEKQLRQGYKRVGFGRKRIWDRR